MPSRRGEHQIQHHEVERMLGPAPDRLESVTDRLDAVPRFLEQFHESAPERRTIFDDQNVQRTHPADG